MQMKIKRIEKILRVALLKQVMKRWRDLSLSRSLSGSDSGSNRSVRAGFLAVYVGPERRRFMIPTRYLNLPVFASLLERAEEEYGFQPAGGLALPCDVTFFRWVIDALGKDEDRFKGLGVDGFLNFFSKLGLKTSLSSFYKDETISSAAARNSFSPLLLQKST